MDTVAPAPTSFLRSASADKNFWRRSWERYRRNRLALAALCFLILLTAAAAAAPLIAPFDPDAIGLGEDQILQPPSSEHLFGTDELGRDGFSRALYGTRISLTVGFLATLVAITVGVLVGSSAGMAGGWIDAVLMRAVDVLLSVPLFFMIMISQIILSPNIYTVMVIIGLASWMDVARLSRAEFLNLRAAEFVTSARVIGLAQLRIAWRHILPNASGPIIVAATLRVAEAIILESTLSFIGLGIQPPQASLGSMLQKGLTRLQDAPWMVWFPGMLIALTVLAFNFVGDGIRDALDPKQTR